MLQRRLPGKGRSRRRAFTLVELMLVLIIMSIVTVLSLDSIANFEASERPARAAKEALAFFRYARNLAMTNGCKTRVAVNTTTGNLQVCVNTPAGSSSWPVANVGFAAGASNGTMSLTLNSERELVGTKMTVNPSGTQYFVYSSVGTCSPAGSLTFTYGAKTHTLTIPAVGDPQP